MQNFTVQDILNARPTLGVDLLPSDTRVIREESGYSVEFKGYYSLAEIKAIARDLETLNSVFSERPEESAYNVVGTDDNDFHAGPFRSYSDATKRAREFEAEFGESFTVVPVSPL